MNEQVEELYKLGLKCFNQRNYSNAEIYFKKVLELDENHIDSYYYLSRSYQEQEKYDDAQQYFILLYFILLYTP